MPKTQVPKTQVPKTQVPKTLVPKTQVPARGSISSPCVGIAAGTANAASPAQTDPRKQVARFESTQRSGLGSLPLSPQAQPFSSAHRLSRSAQPTGSAVQLSPQAWTKTAQLCDQFRQMQLIGQRIHDRAPQVDMVVKCGLSQVSKPGLQHRPT